MSIFQKREINIFLGDIIKHMSPDRAYENHYSQLQTIVNKVVQGTSDFENLFAMDKFLPVLDMFQKESIKVDVCKTIMNKFSKSQQESFNDPVITNALMFICRVMHDSVRSAQFEFYSFLVHKKKLLGGWFFNLIYLFRINFS